MRGNRRNKVRRARLVGFASFLPKYELILLTQLSILYRGNSKEGRLYGKNSEYRYPN